MGWEDSKKNIECFAQSEHIEDVENSSLFRERQKEISYLI
jgi:hypothetical protein